MTPFLYVAAIVLANVGVSIFGPNAAPVIAFLLIGAVLTLRDKIHDQYGPGVVVYLVVLGTVLCVAYGGGLARIALAGALAFAISETVDTGVYAVLKTEPWLFRVNMSNFFGAMFDSVIFPTVAFDEFPMWIIPAQFAAKFAGGAVWAYVIHRFRKYLD